MARLIDVTDLINTCKSLSDEHETTSISYNALYEVLLKQPIAYNVDKVVEELSREFKPILTEKKGFLGISQLVLSGYEINPSKAIDIVRKGGV